MKKLNIPQKETCDLYLNKNLSSGNIAKLYGCSKRTVLIRLHKWNVKLRCSGLPRLELTKNDLEKLYLEKKLSTWKIAELLKCGRSTIHRKLRRFNIEPRDISDSHLKYKRKSFSGDPLEKAYLIGFATGDLRVRKVGQKSKTIKVDCGSNRKEQIKLINNLFNKYGRIWTSKPNPNRWDYVHIEAFLDLSFYFLLNPKKEIENIFKDKKQFIHFLAGFIDADGSFYITNNQGRFSIGNYNVGILKLIRKKLLSHGVEIPKLYKDKKLYNINGGYKRKKYYWHLFIHKKESLLKLFEMVGPFLKHEKRRLDMEKAKINIEERNKKFTQR